jgi:hypothetical protein
LVSRRDLAGSITNENEIAIPSAVYFWVEFFTFSSGVPLVLRISRFLEK